MKISSKQLGRAVLFVIAVCVCVAAFSLFHGLREHSLHIDVRYLSGSIVVLACGYVALALTLGRVLHKESGESPAWPWVFELSFRGLLARYLPGKVGIPAVRMAAAAEFSVSLPFMAATVVMETLASLATAGAVSALLCVGPWAVPVLSEWTAGPWSIGLGLSILMAVVVLATRDMQRYPRALLRLLRSERRTGPLLRVDWLLGCTANWLCVAVSAGLMALALSESLETARLAALACVVGPVVGILTVVSPGGLGVREAFVVALLSPQVGPTRALAFSLVSRAAMLATELLLWAIARLNTSLRAAR